MDCLFHGLFAEADTRVLLPAGRGACRRSTSHSSPNTGAGVKAQAREVRGMTEAHFPTGCRRASKTQSCWGRPRRPELLPENGDCGKSAEIRQIMERRFR